MAVPRVGLWLATCALALAARGAAAQVEGCGEDAGAVDGDFEVTPEDGAEQVARNAPIVVRYARDVDLDALQDSVAGELEQADPVPCAGQLVCVLESESEDTPRALEADVERDGQVITLTPAAALAADTEHTVLVVQPGLDLVARSESTFRTGQGRDLEPPELGYDAEDVSVSVVELPPECGEPAGTRRVVLELPPATDDGDAESVTLEVVLLGEGGGVRARARNDGDPVLVSFNLSPAEAARRTCVELHAYDALGQKAEREPRVCFNPSARPLFSSACASAPRAHDNTWGASAWFCLLGLTAWLLKRLGRQTPA